MLSVHITPEANEAIISEFKLIDMLKPALIVSLQSSVAEVTRSVDGKPEWTIERPQRLWIDFANLEVSQEFALAFPEYAKDQRNTNASIIVDGILIIIDRIAQQSFGRVDVYLEDGELFVQGRSSLEPIDKFETRDQETKGLKLGLLKLGRANEITAADGLDKLHLWHVAARGGGYWFHSMQWDHYRDGQWKAKIVLSQRAFQGEHRNRRWISSLGSLNPETGVAAIMVAEGEHPIYPLRSNTFRYSWRAWDLAKNVEVERIKNCDDPFESLD